MPKNVLITFYLGTLLALAGCGGSEFKAGFDRSSSSDAGDEKSTGDRGGFPEASDIGADAYNAGGAPSSSGGAPVAFVDAGDTPSSSDDAGDGSSSSSGGAPSGEGGARSSSGGRTATGGHSAAGGQGSACDPETCPNNCTPFIERRCCAPTGCGCETTVAAGGASCHAI